MISTTRPHSQPVKASANDMKMLLRGYKVEEVTWSGLISGGGEERGLTCEADHAPLNSFAPVVGSCVAICSFSVLIFFSCIVSDGDEAVFFISELMV